MSANNHLLYRGYVVDKGTGLYYLQSRYFDPNVGRFINADGLVSTGQGLLGNNMFSYCLNNPIRLIDPTGHRSITVYKSEFDGIVRDVTDELMYALTKELDSTEQFMTSMTEEPNYTFITTPLIYIRFYLLVNHEAPWDIKRPAQWDATIGTVFPGEGVYVRFDGRLMTPEQLGNYTYGVLGYAYGIPLNHLILGSYYAADFPTEGPALENELMDWGFVTMGYNAAKNSYHKMGG